MLMLLGFFAFVDGFEINHIQIENAPSASIMLYNSRNGVVEHTTILDNRTNEIFALKDIDNITISNNVIDHTDNQNGIYFPIKRVIHHRTLLSKIIL